MIKSRQEIIETLQDSSLAVIKWVSEQKKDDFNKVVNDKWTTAQQLDHLTKSIKPLVMILNKPKFIMRYLFGKPNRDVRSYDQVVDKYLLKLKGGGKASGQFIPGKLDSSDKKKLLNNYTKYSEKLERVVNKFNEDELDSYLLPHPLLGKMLLREMLFFTIYHTQHHCKSMKYLYS